MLGLIKTIAVAAVGGAAIGAVASQKVGGWIRGDEQKARAKRTNVKVVEVPVDTDDPDELDFVVLKRTKKQKRIAE